MLVILILRRGMHTLFMESKPHTTTIDMDGVEAFREEGVQASSAVPTRCAMGWRKLPLWTAVGFGSGLSPWAPGTVGTLWGWLFFVVVQMLTAQWLWFWPVFLVVTALGGCWVCKVAAEHYGVMDPSCVVWDEIWAICLVLYVLQPAGEISSPWQWQLLAFALFRVFDAVKRGPVGWVDGAMKGWGWKGAVGIMLDDLVAAWLTLMVVAAVRWVM